MKKAVAIAALVVGLFGIALFVTAVQMGRARIEKSAAETVAAVRNSQQSNFGGSYRDWPGRGGK